jgi:hypothetical protein
MTEKQIEQLKKALADSSLPDSSTQLDQTILQSAHQAARRYRLKSDRRTPRLFDLLPLAFLRTASLSIVFTIGVFFAMGQLVKVDENTLVLKDASEINKRGSVAHSVVSESVGNLVSQRTFAGAEKTVLEPLPSGLSRDQILMSFELSDSSELLAKLSFEFNQSNDESNDGLNSNAAELAMSDINSLIQVGELANARQRYAEFIIQCAVCGLPKTLEDLVLAAHHLAIENSAFETG